MLEELKKINFQSGRDEIIYFLCKVIGASSINRNDAIVLCNHAPGKHHLSCDDIIHNPVQHIMENNLWLVEPQSYHIQKVKF